MRTKVLIASLAALLVLVASAGAASRFIITSTHQIAPKVLTQLEHPGAAGAQGPQGIVGQQGPAGLTGATGAAGTTANLDGEHIVTETVTAQVQVLTFNLHCTGTDQMLSAGYRVMGGPGASTPSDLTIQQNGPVNLPKTTQAPARIGWQYTMSSLSGADVIEFEAVCEPV